MYKFEFEPFKREVFQSRDVVLVGDGEHRGLKSERAGLIKFPVGSFDSGREVLEGVEVLDHRADCVFRIVVEHYFALLGFLELALKEALEVAGMRGQDDAMDVIFLLSAHDREVGEGAIG